MVADLAADNNFEDLQTVDSDIESLFKKYIEPIDQLRSYARPILSADISNTKTFEDVLLEDSKNLESSTTIPMESRRHCFYRMLGLPVLDSQGRFYNPGFPLNLNVKSHNEINSDIFKNLKELQSFVYLNEREIFENKNVYINKSNYLENIISNVLYSYVGKFTTFKLSESVYDIDQQSSLIKEREEKGNFYAKLNGELEFDKEMLDLVQKYKTQKHVIVPLMVDPRLVNTVTPDNNLVCIPFLKDKSQTKINNSTELLRPGLELIIRQRLEDYKLDSNYLKTLSNILVGTPQSSYISDDDYLTLKATVSAFYDFSANAQVSKMLQKMSATGNTGDEELQNITNFQFKTVNKLIKTLKACVKDLQQSILYIEKLKSNINWAPQTGVDGPSSKIDNKLNSFINISSNKLNNSLKELKIKKVSAEFRQKNFEDLGSFASPFHDNDFSENINFYDDQIKDVNKKIEHYSSLGFSALRNIELITGQVSGFGLVDVLAIYTALWSIDLNVLISLLDDSAFERLYNYNTNYQGNQAVSFRKNNGSKYTGDKAISLLTEKLFQTLSFVDFYMDHFVKNSPANINSNNFEG
jgi:hypothetical protein